MLKNVLHYHFKCVIIIVYKYDYMFGYKRICKYAKNAWSCNV